MKNKILECCKEQSSCAIVSMKILFLMCSLLLLTGCPSVKSWNSLPENASQQLCLMLFRTQLTPLRFILSLRSVLQWTGELQSVDSPSELKAILRWIFPTGNCVAKWLFPGMGGRFYIGFSLIAIMLRMPEESLGRSKYMTCCEARQKRTGTSL